MRVDTTGESITLWPRTLMAFSETPTSPPGPPPPLGEHTEEMMAALGFDAAEIENVRNHAEAEKQVMLICAARRQLILYNLGSSDG